jgi:hypothetical protein
MCDTKSINPKRVKLTEMETEVMIFLKDDGNWYNWGSEPSFSDVFYSDILKYTKIEGKQLRGVLASLVKKNMIDVQNIGDHPSEGRNAMIIYPTLFTYIAYEECTLFVAEEMGWRQCEFYDLFAQENGFKWDQYTLTKDEIEAMQDEEGKVDWKVKRDAEEARNIEFANKRPDLFPQWWLDQKGVEGVGLE